MPQKGSFSDIVFLGSIMSLTIDCEVAHHHCHNDDDNN